MTLKTLEQATEEATNRKIIVAVDFGTTYSGIAWAQTARHEIQTTIVQWPDTDGSFEGQTSDKVPTVLLNDCNSNKTKWGFEVPEDEPRYQWFKLGLDPKRVEEVSHLSIEYPDTMSLAPVGHCDAVKLTTVYLSKIREHTYEILKLKLGKGVVNTTPIEFMLTVPAMYDDGPKARTMACASAAGMGDKIGMVSEPEAAVVYALDAMDPHNLKKGDTFVLCDAGGGTVDLISYTIEELSPNVKVREAAKGEGDICGSSFLNRIFSKWLSDSFEYHEGWGDDTKEAAMSSFEETAKRKFSGDEKQMVIQVPGLADDPAKGVKRGRLTIPAATIKSLFEPVIAMITTLVKGQLKKTHNAKAVLLVGGFGQSPYLRKSIEKIVGRGVEVMQPAGGWTAVVRGALIRALSNTSPDKSRISIASRVARKAYGMRALVDYRPRIHEESRMEWDEFDGRYKVEVMHWLVNQGDNIDETLPLTTYWYRVQPVCEGPFRVTVVRLYAYSSKEDGMAPRYPCRPVRQLVDLSADLSTISETLVPIKRGKDDIDYYYLNFQIKVAFFSAHTEYSLWYKGTQYGKIMAEYA